MIHVLTGYRGAFYWLIFVDYMKYFIEFLLQDYGAIMCDPPGCEPYFFVNTKKGPSY